jgi:hypothetical protein
MDFLKRLIIRDSIIPFELQNKINWSVLLKQYDEVPIEYRDFYEPFVKKEKPFPYSVFTPSYDIFSSHSTEKLVCLADEVLYIISKKDILEKPLKFPFNKIQYIQFRSVLLDSNLSITGTDDQGEPISAEVRFNTVSEYLFKKIVKIIRQNSFTGPVNQEPYSFDEFRAENLKFANFAQHCLIPGEKVIQLIWQPELLHSLFHNHNALISRPFFPRRVFPNHLLMLTDQELIHISEDNQYSHSDRYGGKWEYIPLDKIKNAMLNPDQDGIITLTIELAENKRLESRYLPTNKSELSNLVKALIQPK